MIRRPLASVLALTLGALLTAPAFAEERNCTGTIGAISLDNVFVPDGATCVLNKTRLKGNIVVGSRSKLTATSVSVNGNVQAEDAQNVTIEGRSIIGGSVQVVQGYAVKVTGAKVEGTILIDENTGPVVASRNRVNGDLQLFQNSGGARLVDNIIGGNLQCKENTPPPTGQGNRADSKEDQCERL
jgi:hypothetical protein